MRRTLLAIFLTAALTAAGQTRPDQPVDQSAIERDVRRLIGQRYKDYVNPHPITLYGSDVLPIVEKLLAAPDKLNDVEVSRLLGLIRMADSPYPSLRPHVLRYLRSEDASIRSRAIEALAVVGNNEDAPALVALLWDLDYSVRQLTVRALGVLGDESALLALEIWQKQVAESDRERPPEKRWLYEAMVNEIEQAKIAIQKRMTTPSTSPSSNGIGRQEALQLLAGV